LAHFPAFHLFCLSWLPTYPMRRGRPHLAELRPPGHLLRPLSISFISLLLSIALLLSILLQCRCFQCHQFDGSPHRSLSIAQPRPALPGPLQHRTCCKHATSICMHPNYTTSASHISNLGSPLLLPPSQPRRRCRLVDSKVRLGLHSVPARCFPKHHASSIG
jgi:hypothetical protein